MEGTFSVVKSFATLGLGMFGALALVIPMIDGAVLAQEPVAAVTAGVSGRIDPQARQMLDRTIRALGGQTFLTAKSLTTKGRAFFFQDGATVGMEPFESWAVFPSKRRFSYGKTKPVILINNGDKGWELDRYGLIAQPDHQLEGWILSNRYSLENVLRLRINEPSVLIQMGKVDFVDNVPTQGIEIIAPGGTSVRLDLQRDTLLPCRITYRVRNVKEDAWDEYSDAYADYKDIDGIQTPMHITRYLNDDRIGETFRNFGKYNEDYPPNYFTPE
jgi:hypothetical protein